MSPQRGVKKNLKIIMDISKHIKEYEQQIQLLQKEQPDGWTNSVKQLYTQLIKYVQEQGDELELAESLYNYALFLFVHMQQDQFVYNLLDKALGIYTKQNDEIIKKEVESRVGYILYLMGCLLTSPEHAIQKLENSVIVYKKAINSNAKDITFLISTLDHLANRYIDATCYDKAIRTNEEILRILETFDLMNSARLIADTYYKVGMTYKKLNLYSESESAFKKAVIYYQKEVTNDSMLEIWIGESLINLAYFSLCKSNYFQANSYASSALKIWKRYNSQNQYNNQVAAALDYVANANLALGKLYVAKDSFVELLNIYRKLAESNPIYNQDIKRTEQNIQLTNAQLNTNHSTENIADELSENIGESIGEELGNFFASLFKE